MTSTGQYYFNARWYDPNLGRFTTEDPIRDGLNWYAYANNNPLKYVDPTGLQSTAELDYRDYGLAETDYSVSGDPDFDRSDIDVPESSAITSDTSEESHGVTIAIGVNANISDPGKSIENLIDGTSEPTSATVSAGIFIGTEDGKLKIGFYGVLGAGDGTPNIGAGIELGYYTVPPSQSMNGKSVDTGITTPAVSGSVVTNYYTNKPIGLQLIIGPSFIPIDFQAFVENTGSIGDGAKGKEEN